jgi:aminoglycoside phosphotransferase (APT) family kinase protein
MNVSLEACLPADLRGPTTTITKISAGLSGAGVHRVDAGGRAYVLKLSATDEPVAAWRRTLRIRQLAADAGVAPPVVHVDEARRAVLSAFVVNRSFPALYWDPRTHDDALALLGRTVRRVHEIPLPPEAEAKDARELLAATWSALGPDFAVPAFVRDVVERVLTGRAPASTRAPVLSHNDVNPSNLVYDGERLLLLDWEAAGANDPFFDLATVSLFLRMDAATCAKLVAAYDDAPVAALPARFEFDRRLVAAFCGATFPRLARERGHPGAAGGETLESTISLQEVYLRMRSGSLSLATGEGLWSFGVALVKEGAAF